MRYLVAILAAMTLVTQVTQAAIPPRMSYQGVLSNAAGTVMDGPPPVEFLFRIYDAESGGAVLWQETQSVLVENGIFDVILGAVVPISLPFDGPYWLGVTIPASTGVELAPRTALVTSPYAFYAGWAETAQVALSSPPADTLWEADGGNVFRPTGNVGIGKNPESLLDIQRLGGSPEANAINYTTMTPQLRLNSTASGNHQSEIQFTKAGQLRWSLFNDVGGNDSQSVGFKDWLAGTIPFMVDQSGNVGIGTTVPSGKLEVKGIAYGTGGLPHYVQRVIASDTGVLNPGQTLKALEVDADFSGPGIPQLVGVDVDVSGVGSATRYAALFRGGNVGVNTANPAVPLDVAGSGRFVYYLEVQDDGSRGPQLSLVSRLPQGRQYSVSSGEIPGRPSQFNVVDESAGGLPRLSINEFGNVGIGNATPQAKLHVTDGDVAVSSPGTGIILRATNGSNCYRITIDNDGEFSKTLVPCP